MHPAFAACRLIRQHRQQWTGAHSANPFQCQGRPVAIQEVPVREQCAIAELTDLNDDSLVERFAGIDGQHGNCRVTGHAVAVPVIDHGDVDDIPLRIQEGHLVDQRTIIRTANFHSMTAVTRFMGEHGYRRIIGDTVAVSVRNGGRRHAVPGFAQVAYGTDLIT